jgi:transposase-like protein
MPPLSYSGYRFPGDIIQRAVWMYLRFTLSFRDVEELLAERGIVVTLDLLRFSGERFGWRRAFRTGRG